MKTIIFFTVVLMLFVLVLPAYAVDVEAYTKANYINWTEHCGLRDPFVKETGWLYSLGVNVLFHPSENIFSALNLEGFEGSLKYKGAYMSDDTPVELRSTRLGVNAEAAVGYKINISEKSNISPFIALGTSEWVRFGEFWNTGFGKIGVRLEKEKFFFKAGLLLPFYTEVDNEVGGVSWINGGKEVRFKTRPKNINTYFGEVGGRYEKMTLGVSYELKKWEASDRVIIDGSGSWAAQPDTVQKVISFKIGIEF